MNTLRFVFLRIINPYYRSIFMKKYLTLLFLSVMLGVGLVSCEGDDPITYRYTLENQSGVSITLKPFFYDDTGRTIPRKEIILRNEQKIEKKEKMYPPSFDYNFVDFFETKEGRINKLEVIYDNKKKKVFLLQRSSEKAKGMCETEFGVEVPCDSRNILNINIYRNVNEHYIFTAEDYQQAEDCKGYCE